MPHTLPARLGRWAMWRPTNAAPQPTRSGPRERQRLRTTAWRPAVWSASGSATNSPTRSENLYSTTSGCATSCAGLRSEPESSTPFARRSYLRCRPRGPHQSLEHHREQHPSHHGHEPVDGDRDYLESILEVLPKDQSHDHQDPDHRDTADDEETADDSLQPGESAKAQAAEEERQTHQRISAIFKRNEDAVWVVLGEQAETAHLAIEQTWLDDVDLNTVVREDQRRSERGEAHGNQ